MEYVDFIQVKKKCIGWTKFKKKKPLSVHVPVFAIVKSKRNIPRIGTM